MHNTTINCLVRCRRRHLLTARKIVRLKPDLREARVELTGECCESVLCRLAFAFARGISIQMWARGDPLNKIAKSEDEEVGVKGR